MQDISAETIESLKAAGHYVAAGALAASLGRDRDSYGCHFGMRSDLARAKRLFREGWNVSEGLPINS